MNYIVLDLEWNQSNTGEEPEVREIPFEIIEIGAVKLNDDFEMTGRFHELIRPKIYREMHFATKKLIHLRMEELEGGKSFPEAAADFLKWCGDEYCFCTWGPLDLTELQRNMRYYHMPPLSDGPLRFYDVQKLFGIAFEDRSSRRALEHAVDFLKLEKDIPFHRAYADAYYTAKVLARIDRSVLSNYSFDVFTLPADKKSEVHVVFDTYAKYISRVFDSKADALADREVMSTKCYYCRRNIKRRLRWFSPNGKHYYCVSYCNIHGYMKAKVRIRKTEDDRVYVIKTTRFIPEEEVLSLKEKRDGTKEQRKKRSRHKKKT